MNGAIPVCADIVFENCEMIQDIPISTFTEFRVSIVNTSYSITNTYELNSYEYEEFDRGILLLKYLDLNRYDIERLQRHQDITQISMKYYDGTTRIFCPRWHDDDDFSNRYQTCKVNKGKNSQKLVMMFWGDLEQGDEQNVGQE